MGIIGDAFGKLFEILWQVATWIIDGIKDFIQTIVDVIVFLIELFIALIQGLLYFIYMIGVLGVKLFQVLLEAGQMLWSLIVGFGRTLASLSYSPTGSSGNGYSDVIGRLFTALEPMQLTPVAYILLFLVWFTTAVSAIKLLSSIRVGGD
ncbi:hypothetical protein [Virgibacillus salexigens]|uniref:Uncharacterized protein n=1 Tax=Virgibacillus massiliensis TaxID=1462526 RepID=A0A024QIR1_9BACI|nr:hypothetical protein [Virgibacillus massiliensis]CDQ42132.1 hypothetical protein BN990_04512 [Virgibacillus massiliensis]